MPVVLTLVGVIVAAFVFVGFCVVRMAGLVSREERADIIPTRKDS